MKTLTPIDIALFATYIGVLFGIGVWFSRQQKDLKSYLLADQNVHWIIVAMLVMAALFSGISFLTVPAETFFYNLSYVLVSVSYFIATPITTLLFMPFFRGLNLITAYEYLERRFDHRLRWLASAMFICRVTLYVATAIYAPALALSTITDLSLAASIFITGITATIYTALGGMKAVIWTDTLQFLVLCGGIVIIAGFAIWHVPGGLIASLKIASDDQKTKFLDFSLNPTVRITFWSGIIGGCAHNLVQLVTDQISVQRYLTAKSLRDAQRALWLKLGLTLPIVFLFYICGTVLYTYYRSHPEQTPSLVDANLVPKLHQPADDVGSRKLVKDQILPYFVVNQLPTPIPGLLIAALYGATMAVVSSGINSLATAAMMDFRKNATINPSNERKDMRLAGGLTLAFGIVGTGLAFEISQLSQLTGLIVVNAKLQGIIGGPLLGLFFLGVLSTRANALGAFVGTIIGLITSLAVAMSQNLFDIGISFLWVALSAALSTFATGWLFSLFAAPPTPAQKSVTYWRATPAVAE